MAETQLEEARRCPKCGEGGKLASVTPTGRRGDTLHVFECMNKRCRWYRQSGWLVQVRADGTIAQPQGHDKSFQTIPDRTDQYQKYYDRLYEDTLTPGAEVRNG